MDPRFVGEGLDPRKQTELEDILVDTQVDDSTPAIEEKRVAIYMQYMAYLVEARNEKNGNSWRFKMFNNGKTAFQYWQTDGSKWPELQQVSLKLFSMAASSGASERKFSTMDFTHSKIKSSLPPETVEKLVYIKLNYAVAFDAVFEKECVDQDNIDFEEYGEYPNY